MIAVETFNVGERVTLRVQPEDPLEIVLHSHAIVVALAPGKHGESHWYMIGHPQPAGSRRFGPYSGIRLMRGWVEPR